LFVSESTERERWQFGDQQKAAVVRRHLRATVHIGQIPRDWWLEDWEKQAIIDYHERP
jgi:hypothetical protein